MASTSMRRFGSIDHRVYGPATISGQVKVLTTPVSRVVMLLEQEDLRIAKTTRSSAVDGSFSFPNVLENRQWLLLSIDSGEAYNAVVADRVQT